MKPTLPFFRYLLATLARLACLLTLVSVLPTPVWWVQVAGFPRLQTLMALGLAGEGSMAAAESPAAVPAARVMARCGESGKAAGGKASLESPVGKDCDLQQ